MAEINKTLLRAAHDVRAVMLSWDSLVPIGTPCIVDGVKTKTWSHAGLGPKGVPSVFVDDIYGPVPLTKCHVNGVNMVGKINYRNRKTKTGTAMGLFHEE